MNTTATIINYNGIVLDADTLRAHLIADEAALLAYLPVSLEEEYRQERDALRAKYAEKAIKREVARHKQPWTDKI